jgi:hypothetical protein
MASLPTKGSRFRFFITGDRYGNWDLEEEIDWGFLKTPGAWYATPSLSLKNDKRNLSVEGATEHHRGFRKALAEIVAQYPELRDWWISFDGPYKPLSDLVAPLDEVDWSKIVFYHGTSLWAWDTIQHEGLKPRAASGADPAYGTGVGAREGRKDAVYLTTQMGMARMAARDASNSAYRKGHGEGGIILRIRGINARFVAPDEDSRETDALRSLEKLGSIAYLADIPLKLIRVEDTLFTPKPKHAAKGLPVEIMDQLRQHVQATGDLEEAIEDLEGTPFDTLYLPGRIQVDPKAMVRELKLWRPRYTAGDTVVYHATDRKTANFMLKNGVIPQMKPWTSASVDFEETGGGVYAPGRGLERGIYVGGTKDVVSGYGPVTLAFKVPKKWLKVPEEMKRLGYKDTPEDLHLALNSENGAVIAQPIHKRAIKKV